MMIASSIQTRGVILAYLIGPPRFVSRIEAAEFYNAVCDALKLDDLNFQYESGTRHSDAEAETEAKGFKATLQRKEGRGGFQATVDHRGGRNPVRLMLSYDWPPSPEHVTETFNIAHRATLDSLEGDWQKVMAEVRIRAQCSTSGNDGLAFLRTHVLGVESAWLESLGPSIGFASMHIHVNDGKPGDDSLAYPRRELKLEPLRDDPKSIYIELMSQWRQIPEPTAYAPAVDLSAMREIDREPQEYIEESRVYLQSLMEGIASAGDEGAKA